MDFKEIVLNGFLNKNNNKYLDEYYLRQIKEAIEKDYSLKSFENGCLDIIKGYEVAIRNKEAEEWSRIHDFLYSAKNNRTNYLNSNNERIDKTSKEYAKIREENINYFEKRIFELKKKFESDESDTKVDINYDTISQKLIHIGLKDVNHFRMSLTKAVDVFLGVKNKNIELTPKFRAWLIVATKDIKTIHKKVKSYNKIEKIFLENEKDFKKGKFRSYISDSMGTNKESPKNLYSPKNNETLISIFNYCKKNNLKMNPHFIEEYNKIHPIQE